MSTRKRSREVSDDDEQTHKRSREDTDDEKLQLKDRTRSPRQFLDLDFHACANSRSHPDPVADPVAVLYDGLWRILGSAVHRSL